MSVGRRGARLVIGGLFIGHGTQKLFGWFGGPGRAGTEGMLEALEMRAGEGAAPVAGGTEAGAAAPAAGGRMEAGGTGPATVRAPLAGVTAPAAGALRAPGLATPLAASAL